MNCEGAFLRHEGALRRRKRLWKPQSAIRIPGSDDVAGGDALGRFAARPGAGSVSEVPSASLTRTERGLGLRKAKLRARRRFPVSRAPPRSEVTRSLSSERGHVSQRRSGRRNVSLVRKVRRRTISVGASGFQRRTLETGVTPRTKKRRRRVARHVLREKGASGFPNAPLTSCAASGRGREALHEPVDLDPMIRDDLEDGVGDT
jgi:hypothetical protein